LIVDVCYDTLEKEENKMYKIYYLIPRNPRFLNRVVAFLLGFFWLPCPICGRNFAGYEWLPGHSIDTWSGGEGVCYRKSCGEKAKELNADYFKNNKPPVIYVKEENK
jgi:hypothetical protein